MKHLLFVLTIGLSSAIAQTNFQHYYGGLQNELSYSVTQTYDGGYAIAGKTNSSGAGGYDYFIIRVDAIGDVVWQKTYGGSADETGFSVNVVEAPDSGLILTGATDSFGAGGWDAYTLKVDRNGTIAWNTVYATTASGARNDHGRGISIASNNDVVITGSEAAFTFGTSDALAMRLNNTTGAVIWKYSYGGSGNDHFGRNLELPGGNIIVCGSTQSFGAGGAGNDDCFVVKMNSLGIPSSFFRYGNAGAEALNSIVLTDDNKLICGGLADGGFGNFDFLLMKTDTLGNLIWSKQYGGTGEDRGMSVVDLGNNKGYVMCGRTNSFGAGGYDILVIKTDTAGTIQWSKTFGTSSDEENEITSPGVMCKTSDGGFALTAKSAGVGVSNAEDIFLIKSDGSGDILCSNANVSSMNANLVKNAATPVYAVVGTYKNVTSLTANAPFVDSAFCYCVPDSVCSSCPLPLLSASQQEVCLGDSIIFSLTGNGSLDSVRYYFGDGATSLTESPTYTYTASGTFTVNAYVYQGCGTDTLTITVSINTKPTPFINVSAPSPFCKGAGMLGSNYLTGNQWLYNGSILSGDTAQIYTPDTSGNYTLLVTDINGCTALSSGENIVVHSTPEGEISYGESDTICLGDSILLTAPVFQSYLWSTGATTQSIFEGPFVTSVYSVTVTDANGCTGVLDQKTVVNPVPTKPIIAKNGTVLLSSSSANNQWKKNGLLIGGATAQTYTVTSTGYYSVIVTNQYNCSAESDTIEFNFTGLTDNSLVEALQVFPNPTSDQLNIMLSSYEKLNATIRVRNMLGQEQLVKYNPLASGQNYIMLDVSALNKGSYLLEIQDQQGRMLTKQLFTIQ